MSHSGRAKTRHRKPSLLAGPMREVAYIFERTGDHGGGLWLLVLVCGHPVFRKRHVADSWSAMAHLMFRPLRELSAPKRCQCHFCESGVPTCDPAIMIEAFGGPQPSEEPR